MWYYVDNGILVDGQWWPGVHRCMRAMQALASVHVRLLGVRGSFDPPHMSYSKKTNRDTRLENLG